ncbi:hypothetical protein GCM10029963_25290 [Micromonospora andamanensis]
MWDPDDALSHLLRPLRLRGAYVSDWRLGRGWAVRGEPEPRALLHHIREGHAVIRLANGETDTLHPGDLAIFPRGAAHVIAEKDDAVPQQIDRLLPDRTPGSTDVLDLGTEPRTGSMLCAGLDYEAAGEYPYTGPFPISSSSERTRSKPTALSPASLPASLSSWTSRGRAPARSPYGSLN